MIRFIFSLFISFLLVPSVFAQDFSRDLSITDDSVQVDENILNGYTTRIYVRVLNNSSEDLFGVVKFYDEKESAFIGTDQPVSVVSNSTDDVFMDWDASGLGEHNIAIRLIPWDEQGDNPDNNKIVKVVYVDHDTDGDGLGDKNDPDDDNDGVPDNEDTFPRDNSETEDTDGDGIGNNADNDDDNDGVLDIKDAFPTDPNEFTDTDSDGVGDNTDPFPTDPNEAYDSDNDGVGDNTDINDSNHGPIPQIEHSGTHVSKGKIVTFNALKSSDPDGEITSFVWDFGDGTTEEGVIVDHIYEKLGSYDIKLTAVDNSGEERVEVLTIYVSHRWQALAFFSASLILLVLLLFGYFKRRKPGKVPKPPKKVTISKKKVLRKKKK